MNDRQMKYYNMGQNARGEGISKDAVCVFCEVDRAFWYAGWHDKDIEIIGLEEVSMYDSLSGVLDEGVPAGGGRQRIRAPR